MKKNVTISDVAKLSNISVSTVSRVINNSPHVSPQKRQLVLDAMKQLGYKPLASARRLRGSKANTLVVTVPRITNPFFASLVNIIELNLDVNNYSTILVQTFGRKDKELAALEMLRTQEVDGIILCSLENSWSTISSYLDFGAIVLVNEYLKSDRIPIIRANQYEGFKSTTESLINSGYRKIAYVTGHKEIILTKTINNDLNTDRFLGFRDALNKANLSFNPDWFFPHCQTIKDGRKIIDKIVDLKNRPDVIIAGSDEVAIGMLEEARNLGISIPKEVAILGVDDQPTSADLFIPLSTIRQPIEEMGQKAAQAILESIEDPSYNSKQVFNLEFIKRKST